MSCWNTTCVIFVEYSEITGKQEFARNDKFCTFSVPLLFFLFMGLAFPPGSHRRERRGCPGGCGGISLGDVGCASQGYLLPSGQRTLLATMNTQAKAYVVAMPESREGKTDSALIVAYTRHDTGYMLIVGRDSVRSDHIARFRMQPARLKVLIHRVCRFFSSVAVWVDVACWDGTSAPSLVASLCRTTWQEIVFRTDPTV